MAILITQFLSHLNNSFITIPNLVTEDYIRCVFACVHGPSNCEIEIPYCHPKSKLTPFVKKGYFVSNKPRADIVYFDSNNNADMVIEFKYHRSTPISQNCTSTKMGSAFRDLNRLSTLSVNEKYLVYVFDGNMQNYYRGWKGNNDPKFFFDATEQANHIGQVYKIGNNNPNVNFCRKDFLDKAFDGFSAGSQNFTAFSYDIKVIFAGSIATGKYMVIYQVQ